MPLPDPSITVQQFLAGFPELSPEEAQAIAEQLRVRVYARGTVLLREGAVAELCYFVLKGCLRQYRTVDGVEKTTQFYTEGQAVVLFGSYTGQTAADSTVVCLEDAVLIEGAPTDEAAMYAQFPKLAAITRTMMAQDFGKMQDEFAHFITSSPEARYQHLLDTRPDLLQRVPQHQLASYLGVTPESLSRIRRRLTGRPDRRPAPS